MFSFVIPWVLGSLLVQLPLNCAAGRTVAVALALAWAVAVACVLALAVAVARANEHLHQSGGQMRKTRHFSGKNEGTLALDPPFSASLVLML
jgi:hypothetical protein